MFATPERDHQNRIKLRVKIEEIVERHLRNVSWLNSNWYVGWMHEYHVNWYMSIDDEHLEDIVLEDWELIVGEYAYGNKAHGDAMQAVLAKRVPAKNPYAQAVTL